MAWQLIYTSAPRLLEAGRSGFGTVARHRQISPLLVAAVERSSQFARLPGMDAERVIFSHRIVSAGGARFHVLSCIRDAGADHTRRTNHLAHHVIADAREVAQLGAQGPSPADALLGIAWLSTWEGTPRYFEDAEEISLASLPVRAGTDGAAWARVTGSGAYARLLTSADASRSACLLVPPGADVRALFAESLRWTPERAWRTTFTTALQPSDDSSEFTWIAVESGSPLQEQAMGSGRVLLDLTAPHTLPVVPAAARKMDAPRTPLAPASVSVGLPAKATLAGRASPAAIAPRRSWKGAALTAALLLLVAVGVTLAVRWQRGKQEQHLAAERVARQFAGSGLLAADASGASLSTALEKLSPPALAQLDGVAAAIKEVADALAKFQGRADFAALRTARNRLHEELGFAQSAQLPWPAGIESGVADLTGALDEALQLEEQLRAPWLAQPKSEGFQEKLQALGVACVRIPALGANLDSAPAKALQPVKDQLQRLAIEQRSAALLALLESGAGSEEEVAWIDAELRKLPEKQASANVLKVLKRARKLVNGRRPASVPAASAAAPASTAAGNVTRSGRKRGALFRGFQGRAETARDQRAHPGVGFCRPQRAGRDHAAGFQDRAFRPQKCAVAGGRISDRWQPLDPRARSDQSAVRLCRERPGHAAGSLARACRHAGRQAILRARHARADGGGRRAEGGPHGRRTSGRRRAGFVDQSAAGI